MALSGHMVCAIFNEMRDEKSPLYRADLAKVLSDASKLASKPKSENKPPATPSSADPNLMTPPRQEVLKDDPTPEGLGSLTPAQKNMLQKLNKARTVVGKVDDVDAEDDDGPE